MALKQEAEEDGTDEIDAHEIARLELADCFIVSSNGELCSCCCWDKELQWSDYDRFVYSLVAHIVE
jgi:hypothetical protein